MKDTFAVAPFTDLKVAVTIHPDRASLLRAHKRLSGETDSSVAAFCFHCECENDVIAHIHFNQAHLDAGLVAHEVQHAVLILQRYWRLNISDSLAEEILAEAAALMVTRILRLRRASKSARRQAK